MKKWTKEEEQYIIDNYKEMTDEEIGKHLNRTRHAVRVRRSKVLGINKAGHRKGMYTKEEEQYIADNLHKGVGAIAQKLGRTNSGIQNKITMMGLSRSIHVWTDEERQFVADNFLTMSDKKISEVLGLSESSVAARRREMGLTKRKKRGRWTEEEEALIDLFYEGVTDKDISTKINRSVLDIREKRKEFELFKSQTPFAKDFVEYALYSGDNLRGIGTIEELSVELNIEIRTLVGYASKSMQKYRNIKMVVLNE